MATAIVDNKGQVTIPEMVRERLRIKPGDKIDFVVDDRGSVVLRTEKIPFEQLRGSVKTNRRTPVTIKEMKKAIEDAAAERYLRSTGQLKAKR
jgi:antitoxin PrlF